MFKQICWPAPSEVNCYCHLAAFEWYTASSIISYIDFDRSKFFMQDWLVLYIIEALRHHVTVFAF